MPFESVRRPRCPGTVSSRERQMALLSPMVVYGSLTLPLPSPPGIDPPHLLLLGTGKNENDMVIESLYYIMLQASKALWYADLDGCICSDVVMYEGMLLHESVRGYYVNPCRLLSPMFDRWLTPRLWVADQVLNKTLYIPCAFITHFGKCILSEPSEICAS